MRNILFIISVLLIVSCSNPNNEKVAALIQKSEISRYVLLILNKELVARGRPKFEDEAKVTAIIDEYYTEQFLSNYDHKKIMDLDRLFESPHYKVVHGSVWGDERYTEDDLRHSLVALKKSDKKELLDEWIEFGSEHFEGLQFGLLKIYVIQAVLD